MEPLNLKKDALKLEVILGYILIVGVIASLSLMITGIVLLYINTGNLIVSRNQEMFIHGQNFFEFIYKLLRGQMPQDLATSLLVTGALALMLTPFIRVIASLIYFALAKDLKYVFITFIVLAILSVSLLIH
jgi:uncharacterized membrane protein